MKGKRFHPEVYIFTPVAPSEGNMCEFMLAKDTAAGATEIKNLTASDIIQKHPRFKFKVYTCNGKTENWYNCEFLTDAKTKQAPAKEVTKKPEPPAEAVKKQEKPEEAPKNDSYPFKIIIKGTKK